MGKVLVEPAALVRTVLVTNIARYVKPLYTLLLFALDFLLDIFDRILDLLGYDFGLITCYLVLEELYVISKRLFHSTREIINLLLKIPPHSIIGVLYCLEKPFIKQLHVSPYRRFGVINFVIVILGLVLVLLLYRIYGLAIVLGTKA